MGTMVFQSTPIMYEAINECGVMGGQFFYANCATYPEIARPNTQAIHPGFVVIPCFITM